MLQHGRAIWFPSLVLMYVGTYVEINLGSAQFADVRVRDNCVEACVSAVEVRVCVCVSILNGSEARVPVVWLFGSVVC